MLLILIAFVSLSLAGMSLFCQLMKKTDKKRLKRPNDEIAKEPKDKVYGKPDFRASIVSWIGDFVFLAVKLVGYIPSHIVRLLFYRHVFHMKIAEKVVIYYGLEARNPWNIKIGYGSIIGDHAVLDARYGIEIGENVNLSTGVWIWTQQHDVNSPVFGTEGKSGKVVIGDRAWISSRTTVLPKCYVAEGAVIAAHAVLTKDADQPFGIYGGVPAKKIAVRNEKLVYTFDGKHRRFL